MKSIAVLMSTYNGERFLREQIDSVLTQKNVDVHLFVRDDGSSDETLNILNEYSEKKMLEWYSDVNMGPAKSFLKLLYNIGNYDFFAFCDQDDVWLPTKLYEAIETINNENSPALYCSDTMLVDANLTPIRKANLTAKGNFFESLVSNPVTGCTMVINKKLRDLVVKYKPSVIDMHDWWIYRVCMAVDGYFYFDKTPHILYRQHDNNVVGGISSKKKKYKKRIQSLFDNNGGIRYHMAEMLYRGYAEYLKIENKEILEKFVCYRNSLAARFRLAQYVKTQPVSRHFRNKLIAAILSGKF